MTEGPRGEKGAQGAQGVQGELSRPLRRALVYLFATAAALALVALLAEFHGQAASRAAQQRQGELVERKLCSTLDGLARLQPPPGNPSTNPSRAYLQGLHLRFIDLGRDLGCGPVS